MNEMAKHSIQTDRHTGDDPMSLTELHPETPAENGNSAIPSKDTRGRTFLVVILLMGGAVLGYEYRALILSSGALLILPLLLCFGMHFFMHRGHGRH